MYGPMSVGGLKQVISPPMSVRALQILLKRLQENEFLIKRYERLWKNQAVFHQLGQKEFQRKKVAELLGCPPDLISQPEYRYRELLHTEACAVWLHHLKAQFPRAKILRDFEISSDETCRHSLLNQNFDCEVSPDLLMKIPREEGEKFTLVGIEVEKTRKSDARLLAKLEKYAERTQLDGVVYICDSGGLIETLRSIYSSQLLPNSKRTKHYAKDFYTFASGSPPQGGKPVFVSNVELETLPLAVWIHFLCSTTDTTRKDASQNLFRSYERSLQLATTA